MSDVFADPYVEFHPYKDDSFLIIPSAYMCRDCDKMKAIRAKQLALLESYNKTKAEG